MVIDEPIAARSTLADHSLARILIVDDEEAVTLTIQAILEVDGYHVTAATSGHAALELVRTQYFDVVLTDLRMEAVTGLDLLKELRSVNPESAAIVLTGYASIESATQRG